MITLRMGAHRDLPPGDPIGRTAMGWEEDLTPGECWARTRGLWLLDERRVLAEDIALVVDPEWIVRAAVRITGITKHGDKRAIEGIVLPAPAVEDPSILKAGTSRTISFLVGMRSPVQNASRNSVAYWPGL